MSASPEFALFAMLRQEEQVRAIKRMAAEGMPECTIAAATRISVEAVRRIIAEQSQP